MVHKGVNEEKTWNSILSSECPLMPDKSMGNVETKSKKQKAVISRDRVEDSNIPLLALLEAMLRGEHVYKRGLISYFFFLIQNENQFGK